MKEKKSPDRNLKKYTWLDMVLPVALATLLWAVMFGLEWGNFWLNMTVSASALALIALWQQRENLNRLFAYSHKFVLIGLASAALLYALFMLGDWAASSLLPFATEQVGGIYAMKSQMPSLTIGLLLVFIIGPAEEIFWRGFLQDRLGERYGRMRGWLVMGIIYGAVHLWAMNFMLFAAALICGLFWGAMFMRWKSLVPVIISHAVWDVAIFVLLPLY